MESRYLLDTNVLIYYSNGILDEKELIDEILENSFNISIISKIEFLGWQVTGEMKASMSLPVNLSATLFCSLLTMLLRRKL